MSRVRKQEQQVTPTERQHPPQSSVTSSLPCGSHVTVYGFNKTAQEIAYNCQESNSIPKEWLPIALLVNQEAMMKAIDPQSQARSYAQAGDMIDKTLLSVNAAQEVVDAVNPLLKQLQQLEAKLDGRCDAIDRKLVAIESKGCCTIS